MALSSGCEIRPCLVWTTEEADDYYSLTSPPFFLNNKRCHMILASYYDMGSEHYKYSLRIEADREDLSNYRSCVALERGGATGLSTSGVFGYSHPSPWTIWEYTQSEIIKAFPGLSIYKFVLYVFSTNPGDAGKAMELTLQSETEQTLKTAEMSTQTSLNLTAVSCLEILSEDMSKFLDEDSRQDVELKCGDQIVKAHGNFISNRSRVFAAMLQSDMAEGRTGHVEIRDMEPELFQCFIRYIYTGKLPPLTMETAIRLYEAGDKYELERLTRRCADFLKQYLSPANACDLLVLADAHSDLNLKEEVITYILEQRIFLKDDHWLAFSDGHLKLAYEVLNRFCKLDFKEK